MHKEIKKHVRGPLLLLSCVMVDAAMHVRLLAISKNFECALWQLLVPENATIDRCPCLASQHPTTKYPIFFSVLSSLAVSRSEARPP